MKKITIYIIILQIILAANFLMQAQDVRTLKTKVADLLAQMPAKSNEHLDRVMIQMLNLGDEGLSEVLMMLKPLGEGNDLTIRFALTSLARYASRHGLENEWNQLQSSFLKTIASASNKEIQIYLIQQLNYGANDQAVDPLKKYLSDERLCEPVAQLFKCIHSQKAEQALAEALPNSTGINQITLVKTLGELKSTRSLSYITKLTGTDNTNLQRTVLGALANIGSSESYNILWNTAEKVSFRYEPTEAMAALLKYADELGKNNSLKLCKKLCQSVIKTNTTKDLIHNQVTAISVFSKYFPQEAMPVLLKKANTPDNKYRMAILNLANNLGDATYTGKWINMAKKSDPSVKADIINMLGNRKDKSAIPVIRESLSDDSSLSRTEAIWALVKLDDQGAIPDLLKHLSNGNDVEVTGNALKTLIDDKKIDLVANALKDATAAGKPGLIEIIGSKSGKQYFKDIYAYTADKETSIKNAAITALKNTASFSDTEALLQLLMQVENPEHIEQVRQALVNATTEEENPDLAIAPILSALQKSTQKEKIVPVLPQIGGEKALKTVTNLFNSSTGELKKVSLDALVNWQDVSAAGILFDICKTGSSEFRSDAYKGSVRQIQKSDFPDDKKLLKYQMILSLAQSYEEKEQIINALANIKTFLSLLCVSKYMDDPVLQQAAANAAARIALPSGDEKVGLFGDIPKAILNKAVKIITGPESYYIKANINKYIESLPDDPGFLPMFNGVDLTGWKGFVADPIKKAGMKEKELAKLQAKANMNMLNNWGVKDGMITFSGSGENLLSEKEYSDFELIVNWKISKNGDSGIYLRGSPQVQIWDPTSGVEATKVGSGGLYNNQVNESKPLKVADNPVGEWNTFRIIAIGDRVTVYLNGELVVNNVVFENYWDRSCPIFPTGTIELQAHGTDLAFKDIYVREIIGSEALITPEEKAEGFVSLFNGKNLDGWVGNKTDYMAEDGNIIIQPNNGEGGGNLYTEKEYSDFDFRFEFQLTPGANNGLGIRAPLDGDAAYVGMELQILDNTAEIYSQLKPYQYHGSVYGVIPAKREFLKPVGEWNYEEVIAKGSHIKIILNGTVIVDGDILEASKNGTADGQEHPGLLREKGHIGFLGHGSVVKFRNIRIEEL
jgi:HEAT repeat protein